MASTASSGGIKAGKAFVELFLDNKKLISGLRQSQNKLRKWGRGIRNLGIKMAAMGAAAKLPLIFSASEFAKFEDQMGKVSTMLDNPIEDMSRFRRQIQLMSAEFGQSTQTLSDGLFDILSASIPAADAMNVLQVSVRAAIGGMTDTRTAADAITTIINSYGLAARDAADVSDWLFTVVKKGKLEFAELAPSIGAVANIAATAGIGLDELGATLALLTRNGIRADEAVTAIRATVSSFLSPSLESAEAARSLGFELSSTTLKAEGFLGVFKRIEQLSPDAVAAIFPNIRALKGVLPALADLKGLDELVNVMKDRAGQAEVAYEKMASKIGFQLKRLLQIVKGVAVAIGSAFEAPIRKMTTNVVALLSRFRDWATENKKVVLSIAKLIAGMTLIGSLLVVVGTGLLLASIAMGGVASVVTAVTSVFTVAFAALQAFLIPIAAVTVAAILLGVTWESMGGVIGDVIDWLVGKFKWMWSWVERVFELIVKSMANGEFQLAADLMWAGLKAVWRKGTNELKAMWRSVIKFFTDVLIDGHKQIAAGMNVVWSGIVASAAIAINKIQSLWAAFREKEKIARLTDQYWVGVGALKAEKSLGGITATEEKGAQALLLKEYWSSVREITEKGKLDQHRLSNELLVSLGKVGAVFEQRIRDAVDRASNTKTDNAAKDARDAQADDDAFQKAKEAFDAIAAKIDALPDDPDSKFKSNYERAAKTIKDAINRLKGVDIPKFSKDKKKKEPGTRSVFDSHKIGELDGPRSRPVVDAVNKLHVTARSIRDILAASDKDIEERGATINELEQKKKDAAVSSFIRTKDEVEIDNVSEGAAIREPDAGPQHATDNTTIDLLRLIVGTSDEGAAAGRNQEKSLADIARSTGAIADLLKTLGFTD